MPVSPSRPDSPERRLRRMKRGALALLGLTISLFLLSHAMIGRGEAAPVAGLWPWLRAFSEAATVGALADWFAVVALFRHPLGLPFPHTAIIPNKKNSLGESLGVFVRDHFLDSAMLLEKLRSLDPAARLGQWLSQPEQSKRVSRALQTALGEALRLLDERSVKQALTDGVRSYLMRVDMAGTSSQILGLLTRNARHQRLLDEVLQQLGTYLSNEAVKQRVAAVLVRYAQREWPKLLAMVGVVTSVDELSGKMADRLARALVDEVHTILSEPEHPLRKDYEQWVLDYIQRLGQDSELREQVEAIKQRFLHHKEVGEYIDGIWTDVMRVLRSDLARPDSSVAAHLRQVAQDLGARLNTDATLRATLNEHMLSAAAGLAEQLREGAKDHISRTVRQWDDRQLVRELELTVGTDLQYIRFNGTVVGGLVGVGLHAILLLGLV
ncbi:DUF445 domain-containing protein [Alcaligenes sp. CHO6]|uniref:DUF445 domain-containing protein n=1 Tax=Alcaligenes sp. CHO6 TaxID=3123298 RepID=UPI00301582B7